MTVVDEIRRIHKAMRSNRAQHRNEMTPIKILLYCPVWGRPKITRLHFDNVERMISFDPALYQIEPLYIVSEDWSKDMCIEFGFDWFQHENLPMGRKLNAGLKPVINQPFDWLLTFGSDNFCEPSFLDEYLPYFETEQAFGLNLCYAIEESTGKQKEMMIGYAFGAMRCIRWDLVRQMDGQLWPEMLNRGLDYYSMLNLKEATGVDVQVVNTEAKLWDVKSKGNINKFGKDTNLVEVPAEEMPQEIQHLAQVTVEAHEGTPVNP